MNKFSVVGIGPGNMDYILPISRKAVENADLLIGGPRQLELFSYTEKRELLLKGNYKEILTYIKENKEKEKIAVLVSGDPGYHSLLGMISRQFSSDQYRVYPGLSSFQVAMARIGEIWNDADLISLHGKSLSKVLEGKGKKLVLLTDHKNTPWHIARYLLNHGYEGREALIAENLTYGNEKIRKIKLKDIIEEDEYKLCVMIIMKKEENSTL